MKLKKVMMAVFLLGLLASCSTTNMGQFHAASIQSSHGRELFLGTTLPQDDFAWSPSGEDFVTAQIVSGIPRLIFWHASSMAYQDELSFYEGPAEWVKWDVESGWILYAVENLGLGGQIYALAPESQTLPDRPLLDHGLWGTPVFVEEGTSILIGESLFFSRGENSSCRIWKVDLSSGEKQMVVQDSFHDLVPSPSPDTDVILYTPAEGAEPQVYLQDGSRLIPLRKRTPFTPEPFWIGDGTRAVFAGPDGLWPERTALWLYDARTRNVESLKEIGEADETSSNLFPAKDLDWWGERENPKILVLMRDPFFPQGSSWTIVEVDPQTRMAQNLLRPLPEEDILSFNVSPDRNKVAYLLRRVELTGVIRTQLWVLNRSTGMKTLLHEDSAIHWWEWSPAGDQIAVHARYSLYLYSF